MLCRYFDEISQDTGKYCFGVDDTLKVYLVKMGFYNDISGFHRHNHLTYIARHWKWALSKP